MLYACGIVPKGVMVGISVCVRLGVPVNVCTGSALLMV